MATSEIYTLSLHDALPISHILVSELAQLEIHQKKTLELEVIEHQVDVEILIIGADALLPADKSESFAQRSEEHTSELQSRPHLVCRLLLEKKKKCNFQ